MRSFIIAFCVLISCQETTAKPSWTTEPYKIGDVFFCINKLKIEKNHKSHELLTTEDETRLSFKITDKKWITFGDRGVLSGQANILSRSDFKLNAVQFSSETEIYMDGRIATLVSISSVSTKIYSMECERF